MTKEQNQIAIKELEGLKEFLEKSVKKINPTKLRSKTAVAYSTVLSKVNNRLNILRKQQHFDEMLHPIFAGEIDKLRKENAELKERLEEALTGGTARKHRIKPDKEYTAHIQQEVADAEVIQTSEEKTEATPSNPEENKYINWNIDKYAWIEQNNKNIKKLLELQKNNDVGTEYDELLFETKITDNNPSQGIIYSRIGTDDAIYKLNTIERLFRDHNIDSLKDLERLLNFAKVKSNKKLILLTKNVGVCKMTNGIESDLNIGMFSQEPIIKTKDFFAEIRWDSIIQIAYVSGLFDKQLEKDRQDKLINKEGGDNA